MPGEERLQDRRTVKGGNWVIPVNLFPVILNDSLHI